MESEGRTNSRSERSGSHRFSERSEPSVPEDAKPKLIFFVMISVLCAAGNQILFKKLLNKFSAVDGSRANMEFFVSQWSTILYMAQALAMIIYKFCVRKNAPGVSACGDIARKGQRTFMAMGLMDGASATLAAIGGAMTPGQLQTLLNQTIIPATMILSFFFIGTKFENYQLGGALLIIAGTCAAAVPFLFGSADMLDPTVGKHTSVSSFSIIMFALSVLPAAMSNVYKEVHMKEDDLDVYVTTSFVSVWQTICGFLFLPLLTLPALGGLTVTQLMRQLPDGLLCFTGSSPSDQYDCVGATQLFMIYVLVNFSYNVLLLIITKKGSAVLLVVANALALPLTNLAFSVKVLMGDDAEPFTSSDIVGLVCVCFGFLIYSSFGYAKHFILLQGTPGQMAYTPMDGWEGGPMVLTAAAALNPTRHASWLVELMGGPYEADSMVHALDHAKAVVQELEQQQEELQLAQQDLRQRTQQPKQMGDKQVSAGTYGSCEKRGNPMNI